VPTEGGQGRKAAFVSAASPSPLPAAARGVPHAERQGRPWRRCCHAVPGRAGGILGTMPTHGGVRPSLRTRDLTSGWPETSARPSRQNVRRPCRRSIGARPLSFQAAPRRLPFSSVKRSKGPCRGAQRLRAIAAWRPRIASALGAFVPSRNTLDRSWFHRPSGTPAIPRPRSICGIVRLLDRARAISILAWPLRLGVAAPATPSWRGCSILAWLLLRQA
jgi:hypothetical protein